MRRITRPAGLIVLPSRPGVDLPAGGPNPALTPPRNCSIRVPVTIRAGLRSGQITQEISDGVVKSANSAARITALDRFFDGPVDAFTVTVPFGARSDLAVTASQTTPISVTAACSTTTTGLYSSTLAVSGTRTSRAETLILGTSGLDFRYVINPTLEPCDCDRDKDEDDGHGGDIRPGSEHEWD